MEIAEFLLARIAEDEARAREAAGVDEGFEGGAHDWCPDWLGVGIRHLVRNCDIECPTHDDSPDEACGQPHRYAGRHIARHDPTRVLAECEAKRAVIKWLTAVVELPDEGWQDEGDQVFATYSVSRALEALALPYAGHEDYDPAWAPLASL